MMMVSMVGENIRTPTRDLGIDCVSVSGAADEDADDAATKTDARYAVWGVTISAI